MASIILNAILPLIKEIPLRFPEPNDIDRWTQIARTQNLELAMARQAAAVAEAEIERIRAGHLPTLDLVGIHHRSLASADQYGPTDTKTSSVALQLEIPLYQGGLVQSRTRQAAHLHDKALDDLARARRGAQRETHDAFGTVVSGISIVGARRQALRSAQAALEAVEAGFEVGIRDVVDILDAQREVFRAKRDHADARYGYVMGIFHLKQASGTLSMEDLTTVNGWLEHGIRSESSPVIAKTAVRDHELSAPARNRANYPQAGYRQDAPARAIGWLRQQDPDHHTIQSDHSGKTSARSLDYGDSMATE